jgi:hypothetical protein
MGEPEPERRRQMKQKLRRTQGAGIWPEAVPKTEGQNRKMIAPQDSLTDRIKALEAKTDGESACAKTLRSAGKGAG